MGTNKKQTAVEKLHSQMMDLICNNELSNREKITMGHNLIYDAKQMERYQNECTWVACAKYAVKFISGKTRLDSIKSFKKYYDQAYGKEN